MTTILFFHIIAVELVQLDFKMVEAQKTEGKVNRRRFLDYLLAGSIMVTFGAVVAAALNFIYPPKKEGGAEAVEKLEVGPIFDLPEGKAKPVVFQNKNVMVIHVKEGFFAVDMKCTHLGCMVEWDDKTSVLKCPCHAAFFDYKGNVISGPAPRALPTYKVEIMSDKIYLVGA